MSDRIKVTIKEKVYTYYSGATIQSIVSSFSRDYDHDIILARIDGKLSELTRTLENDCHLSFITTGEKLGNNTYKRTAVFVMLKAFKDVLGSEHDHRIIIQHSLDKGFYCDFESDVPLSEDILNNVKIRMKEIADHRIDIIRKSIPRKVASALLEESKMTDKKNLLAFKTASSVNLYILDDMIDYFYGYMAPDTSYIKYFDLIPYDEGFVLQLPEESAPEYIKPFEPSEKLFATYKMATDWNKLMGVSQIAELNQKIVDGKFYDLVLIQEALQERWIGNIAQQITDSGRKIVLIAGPSSSGKTSFSKRLSIQLAANGLKSHPISVDNYFVSRQDTPLGEDGLPDYECLEALNIEKLNEHLTKLLEGEEVTLLKYNFITGESEENGERLKIGKDDVLVIEGIHALNDQMTYRLPKEQKFKIYISALTTLNIDDHNRIASNDGRLIRRMCRDAAKRGTSAAHTLKMWKNVRHGEEKNIFPYQEDCDVMFNSVLIYELSILKPSVMPLLYAVQPDEPEYEEAQLMLKFMDQILGVSTEHIPHNSILREFIGGSIFNVE